MRIARLLTEGREKNNHIPEFTGSGPNELIGYHLDEDGVITAGFFGEIASEHFISGDELSATVDFYEGVSINSDTAWLKFLIDGKILFIPKRPIRRSINWYSLYTSGLVYGTDDYGDIYPAATTPQNVTVKINGHFYRVRLIKGSGDNPYTGRSLSNNTEDPATTGSEWNRLVYNVSSESSVSVEEKWAQYTSVDLGTGSVHGGLTICQESFSSLVTNKLARGYYGIQSATSTPQGNNSYKERYGWRPVLELITEPVMEPVLENTFFVPTFPFTEYDMFTGPKYLQSAYVPTQQKVIEEK